MSDKEYSVKGTFQLGAEKIKGTVFLPVKHPRMLQREEARQRRRHYLQAAITGSFRDRMDYAEHRTHAKYGRELSRAQSPEQRKQTEGEMTKRIMIIFHRLERIAATKDIS